MEKALHSKCFFVGDDCRRRVSFCAFAKAHFKKSEHIYCLLYFNKDFDM